MRKYLSPVLADLDATISNKLSQVLTQVADIATARIDRLTSGEAAAATAFNSALQAAVDVAKAFVTAKYTTTTVTALSDVAGPAAGGDGPITLTGTNFLSAWEVAFGAVVVPVGNWVIKSNTEIVVFLTPAQAAGAVNVRVRNAIGQSATAGGNVYTYS